MEIITNPSEITKIVRGKKLTFSDFKIFNTPWATDKEGKRDTTNLSVFVEFEDNEVGYWQPFEKEVRELYKTFYDIKKYNTAHNHQGKKYTESRPKQLELEETEEKLLDF